jgi:hypothetical protein
VQNVQHGEYTASRIRSAQQDLELSGAAFSLEISPFTPSPFL